MKKETPVLSDFSHACSRFVILAMVLTVCGISAAECRGESWTSPDGRFSTIFPQKHQETQNKTRAGLIKKYRVKKETGDAFYAYGVDIWETPFKEYQFTKYDGRVMLKNVHQGYITSIKILDSNHAEFLPLVSGLDKMEFKIEFHVLGKKHVDHGFWFMNGSQVVRIYAIHPETERGEFKGAAKKYLESFKILSQIYIPDDVYSYVQKIAKAASLQPSKCSETIDQLFEQSLKPGQKPYGGGANGTWCFSSKDGVEEIKDSIGIVQKNKAPQHWRSEWMTFGACGYRIVEKIGLSKLGIGWYIVPAKDSIATAPPDTKTMVIAR
jgi:hypothetical protein